jgi:hypothetical protein
MVSWQRVRLAQATTGGVMINEGLEGLKLHETCHMFVALIRVKEYPWQPLDRLLTWVFTGWP